jgi:hypothetical protein
VKPEILTKILRNSGLLKEAGLNFEEPKKSSDDGLDLSFDDGSSNDDSDNSKNGGEINKPDSNDGSNDDSSGTTREKLRNLIKPQVETANQITISLQDAFKEIKTKKYYDILEQMKNFEKQLRGACSQIVSTVQRLNFDTNNTNECSPKAYKIIVNSESRDRSSLDLIAAINVFYNSLESK